MLLIFNKINIKLSIAGRPCPFYLLATGQFIEMESEYAIQMQWDV